VKTRSYNTFWAKIHKSAKKRRIPLRVMFELTYRCNFYCKHCYVPFSYRKHKELETKEVFSILDQLADIGCFYLGFTGGEPFMREDILDILFYARKKGFEVIVYSNGSLIDEKTAKELARLRPNKIDITIPAVSAAAFERISGVKGSRERVFKAIELLHGKKVNMGFKSCVLKENENEIKDIEDFAVSLGALHRLDDVLSPRLDGSKESYNYRGHRTEDRGPEREQREDGVQICSAESAIQRAPVSDLFRCGVGANQAAITPSGELKMCLMIDYPKYKILETSLKDTWERLSALTDNIKADSYYQCDRCELNAYCKWCPARGWNYNRSFTSCDPEWKRKAENTKGLCEARL